MRTIALLGTLVVLAACVPDTPSVVPLPDPVEPRTAAPQTTVSAPAPEPAPEPDPPSPAPLPASVNLRAAFYSQAPDGDWSLPWQEACEEASVLLAANAVQQRNWTRAEFRAEILKLVDWQMEQFGDYLHTDVDQTAEMLQHLGLQTRIHEDPSFEDFQAILARGHFVVATFAGKELGNPYYSGDGPTYHAMLLKGYTADRRVITHDVGTRRGEDYVYRWDVLQRALRDYAVPISSGRKRFIEVVSE